MRVVMRVCLDGSLSIVDRKKNIFKLAQGEYVSPESVEGAVAASKWCGQVWVYGNSFESSVVAIVVPDMEVMKKYIKESHPGKSVEEVLDSLAFAFVVILLALLVQEYKN